MATHLRLTHLLKDFDLLRIELPIALKFVRLLRCKQTLRILAP